MRIHPVDLAIVVVYLLGVTALGMHFRRRSQDARDYFLGGRTAPWWALAFSIVATETSTLTIIGTPAISYGGNLTFLQLVFGYLIGRVLIVLLLLPGYFRGEFFTAYALIEKRFGEKMRAVAATTFLITRAVAEGVRVSAIALVVSVVLGTSERLAVLIVIALTILYTLEGGMKAVIWTDVAQHASGRGGRTQIAGARFFLELGDEIYVLVGADWGGVLDHGEPWDGPDDRAAAFGGAQRTRWAAGVADQRSDCADAVHGFSAHRRAAFCVCAARAAAGSGRAHGPRASNIFGARNARGTGGLAAGFGDCGGNVQRQRRAEFTGGVERAGLFAVVGEVDRRGRLFADFAAHDTGVGIGVDGIWIGAMGTAVGGGADGGVAAVWKLAGTVFAGDSRSRRKRAGRAGGNVCGVGGDFVRVSVYDRGVYVVRDDWVGDYVCGGGGGEPGVGAGDRCAVSMCWG